MGVIRALSSETTNELDRVSGCYPCLGWESSSELERDNGFQPFFFGGALSVLGGVGVMINSFIAFFVGFSGAKLDGEGHGWPDLVRTGRKLLS